MRSLNLSVVLSFARSYRLGMFLLLGSVFTVLSAALPGHPISVPLRENVLAEPWPLALAGLASFLPMSLNSPDTEVVAVMPVRPWCTRLGVAFATSLVALSMLSAAAALAGRSADEALRNYAIVASIAFLLSLFIAAEYVWLGPLVLILSNWLYGVDEIFDRARAWAVLMYGPSQLWLWMGVGLWGLSTLVWVAAGSPQDRSSRSVYR